MVKWLNGNNFPRVEMFDKFWSSVYGKFRMEFLQNIVYYFLRLLTLDKPNLSSQLP